MSFQVKKKLRNIAFICLMIIIGCYFISSLYFMFKPDEDISMGLAQINFKHIISTDSLDVHPPLYYILLKVFLDITTFWTNSVFVKVIFARLFSVIALILFIYTMICIYRLCNIRLNVTYQIILLLLAPGIINESTKIRMYSLSAFVLAYEFYQLLKFLKYNKIYNLVLMTMSAVIASYILYPLAVSSGLFILIIFIIELINKNLKKSLLFLGSGIFMILAYLPWIPIVLSQFKIHSTSDGNLVPNYLYTILSSITQLNASSPTSPLLKYTSILSIFVIFSFLILIIYSHRALSKKFNKILILVLSDYAITFLLCILICKRQFRLTIVYPIYSIFIFLMLTVCIKYLVNIKYCKIGRIFILVILIIFFSYSSMACLNNIKNYDLPSVSFVKTFNQWKFNRNKNIYINKSAAINAYSYSFILGDATKATEDALYLKSINKNAVITTPNRKEGKEFISKLSNDKYNYKFFNKLFRNLKFKKVDDEHND